MLGVELAGRPLGHEVEVVEVESSEGRDGPKPGGGRELGIPVELRRGDRLLPALESGSCGCGWDCG